MNYHENYRSMVLHLSGHPLSSQMPEEEGVVMPTYLGVGKWLLGQGCSRPLTHIKLMRRYGRLMECSEHVNWSG